MYRFVKRIILYSLTKPLPWRPTEDAGSPVASSATNKHVGDSLGMCLFIFEKRLPISLFLQLQELAGLYWANIGPQELVVTQMAWKNFDCDFSKFLAKS